MPQLLGWRCSSMEELRSLTGELSLVHTGPAASWWVAIYMGKPSAVGQPTRPTRPFILSGSINEKWVVSCNQMVAITTPVAPSGERLRVKQEFDKVVNWLSIYVCLLQFVWCLHSQSTWSSASYHPATSGLLCDSFFLPIMTSHVAELFDVADQSLFITCFIYSVSRLTIKYQCITLDLALIILHLLAINVFLW